MAKAKTCAYHLCGQVLLAADPRDRYCSLECYRNAKQWRWRHRKPRKRAAQQHRRSHKITRANTKKIYAQRRRPLATKLEKKLREDGRESPTNPVV